MTLQTPNEEVVRRRRAARRYAGSSALFFLGFVLSSWIGLQKSERELRAEVVAQAARPEEARRAAAQAAQAVRQAEAEVAGTKTARAEAQAAREARQMEEQAARERGVQQARQVQARERAAREQAEQAEQAARRAELEAERRAEAARREAVERQLDVVLREAEAWQKIVQRSEMRAPESDEKVNWTVIMTAVITALGTLATGIGTMSSVRLAWQAESRQTQEFQLKIRQLEHQVQELDEKKREGGPRLIV